MSRQLLCDVMERVEYSQAVPNRAKFLYLLMCYKARGKVYDGSRAQVMGLLDCGSRAVDRIIATLVKAKWIKRTKGTGKDSRKTFTELLF